MKHNQHIWSKTKHHQLIIFIIFPQLTTPYISLSPLCLWSHLFVASSLYLPSINKNWTQRPKELEGNRAKPVPFTHLFIGHGFNSLISLLDPARRNEERMQNRFVWRAKKKGDDLKQLKPKMAWWKQTIECSIFHPNSFSFFWVVPVVKYHWSTTSFIVTGFDFLGGILQRSAAQNTDITPLSSTNCPLLIQHLLNRIEESTNPYFGSSWTSTYWFLLGRNCPVVIISLSQSQHGSHGLAKL